ncbi:amino acid adenylation domain-containing protein [Nonomuraea sp. NPDC050786]|uniref:non-ribosomal peptide synthetase n=1 Tax=Nonomuraea sp. NPDC050786 TaxID=3154840 RepID=UPI0033DCBFCE
MTIDIGAEVLANRKEQAQWMLHRLTPGRGICNVGAGLRLDRRLRWGPLQAAIDHIVWRHPGLRATLHTRGSTLYKRFLPATDLVVPLTTASGTEETLAAQVTELMAEPFDLESGLLLRAHRIVLPTGEVVCLVLHHIVADGVTAVVVLRELVELYDAFAADLDPPPHLAGSAPVYLEAPPDQSAIDYWCAHLSGVDPDTFALPDARPSPLRPTFAGGRVERALSERARAALARLRRFTRTTDNIVLLAAYYLLLVKHGAGPDLVIGVLTNGRRGAAAENVVGYHANTLPLRVEVDLTADFATLVRQTRDVFLVGLEHGEVSFEAIQPVMPVRSADWRVPLFRHTFNNLPTGTGDQTMAGVPVRGVDAYTAMSRVDLELLAAFQADRATIDFRYSTEVHDRGFATTLLARLERLLIALDESLDEAPGESGAGLPVGWVDCDAEGERERAVSHGPARVWPEANLGVLIGAQAVRTPHAMAIDGWTYDELRRGAQTVAATLSAHGIGRGDVVGLYGARGKRLAAGVLGCWAVGAAYLPLEPEHPAQRIGFQLADSGARVVLSDRPLPAERTHDLVVLELPTEPGTEPSGAVPPATGDDPAYISYTSGSTGRPKGVVVSHANLANVVHHFREHLAVTADDRALWSTTFSFDISALELLLPLVSGGEVVVAGDGIRADGTALLDLVVDRDVTILQATPTLWRHLVPHLGQRLRGRRALSGGESLTAALAEELLAAGCRLYHVYGPTETTIWSTAIELTSPVPEPVPIGTPVANTTIHVTDRSGGDVPVGVPGELRIGGTGVALGYRGDPKLTAERFAVHPRHGRMYRTGDRVRQRPDGVLEYLGRTDRQAKVRGHRVEPGEIEAVLERHPEVRAAAVITESDPAGHQRLVAGIQPADPGNAGSGAQPLAARLRDHAAAHLPAAMVPSRFVVLTAMPLTGNSKIDYRQIAAVVADAGAAVPESALPDDPTEELLVRVWRETLGDPRLTVESNFFLSGGHSLLAVQIADQVGTALGRPVAFELIFEAPTPRLLASRLTDGTTPPAATKEKA